MIAVSAAASALRATASVPPLDPDTDTARDWLMRELSKNEYVSAQPTLIDRLINDFLNWLGSLFGDASGAPIDPTGLIVAVVVVIVGIVIALVVGRPAARRSSGVDGDRRRVFLDDDTRTASELRAASEAAARSGDWALAVTERFRAIARDLADRTIISLRPGSTSHAVARRASAPFPNEREALTQAANDFDDVRYLDRAGSEAAWQRTRELDRRLAGAKPTTLSSLEHVAGGTAPGASLERTNA